METVEINKNIKSMKKFYESHPEKKSMTCVCKECGGKYKYYNKSHHNSSKKHLFGKIINISKLETSDYLQNSNISEEAIKSFEEIRNKIMEKYGKGINVEFVVDGKKVN